jgi:hypothetical protein
LAKITLEFPKAGFGAPGTLALWSDAEQLLDSLEIASSEPDEIWIAEFDALRRALDAGCRPGRRLLDSDLIAGRIKV